MSYRLLLPSKTKRVKDLIISVLAKGAARSPKLLHNTLQKQWALSVTYQAVFKALQELCEEGVVLRKRQGYTINPKWLSEVEGIISEIKKSLFSKNLREHRYEGDVQTLIFDTFEAADEYRKMLQTDYFQHASKQYCSESAHLKSPLIFSEKSLSILELIKKSGTKCFLAVRGNTPIDRWCADYYRNELVDVKTGVACAQDCDIMVLGDSIVQLYIPQEVAASLDHIFSQAKQIADISVPALYTKFYKRKALVKMVITKNPELAERLRQRIRSFF